MQRKNKQFKIFIFGSSNCPLLESYQQLPTIQRNLQRNWKLTNHGWKQEDFNRSRPQSPNQPSAYFISTSQE
jgi:hypothetical protein